MFLDEALIEIASGRGGSGAVSFHREKHVPRGGPNGADGGKGGDVIFIADRGKRTLYDFSFQAKIEAQDGTHALGNKSGKNGKDIKIRVPVGTVITNAETGEVIADLRLDRQKALVARGGRGGHGNNHYVSSVRQAPNFAEKGEPEQRFNAKLELKLLADIGIVGLPNAGKSTFIGAVSAAKPKIADYPFTTIVPNLGVVFHGENSFTVADMPGLIEGASAGVGLGHQFLKHVERTAALLHLVEVWPMDESDPVENFQKIEAELKNYSEDIYNKPRLVALSKIDIFPEEELAKLVKRFEEIGVEVFPISAAATQGMEPLLYRMDELVQSATRQEEELVITVKSEQKDEDWGTWEVVATDDGFEVTGTKVARMVAMSNLDNYESVRYLHRRLMKMGIIDKLRDMGAEEGDSVNIGEFEFAFTDY
ncbi:MAG: GTPase ObgE [Fimbriimonadaceae bacterium]|nr:GTPase ObgE [Fimbriimonadaceae bacterium]